MGGWGKEASLLRDSLPCQPHAKPRHRRRRAKGPAAFRKEEQPFPADGCANEGECRHGQALGYMECVGLGHRDAMHCCVVPYRTYHTRFFSVKGGEMQHSFRWSGSVDGVRHRIVNYTHKDKNRHLLPFPFDK